MGQISKHFGKEDYARKPDIDQNLDKFFQFFLYDFFAQNISVPQIIYYLRINHICQTY